VWVLIRKNVSNGEILPPSLYDTGEKSLCWCKATDPCSFTPLNVNPDPTARFAVEFGDLLSLLTYLKAVPSSWLRRAKGFRSHGVKSVLVSPGCQQLLL